jgi:hypothetical protein
MATKSMSYDHPTYTAVDSFDGSATGNAGTTTKFVAFTGCIIKSATLKPTTAGTSNDVSSFIQISGTTTTTTALATFGSAASTFTNIAFATAPTLIQGDTFYVVKGTDATAVIGVSLERIVTPGASVTS